MKQNHQTELVVEEKTNAYDVTVKQEIFLNEQILFEDDNAPTVKQENMTIEQIKDNIKPKNISTELSIDTISDNAAKMDVELKLVDIPKVQSKVKPAKLAKSNVYNVEAKKSVYFFE